MSNRKEFSTRTGAETSCLVESQRKRLVGPEHLVSSRRELDVAGVLNAGCFNSSGRLFLCARVDEVVNASTAMQLRHKYKADAAVPWFDYERSVNLVVPVSYPPNYDPDHDCLLISPGFEQVSTRSAYFSYMSHIRLLEVGADHTCCLDTTIVSPSYMHDCYGCEDARAVIVDGTVTLIYNGLGICGSAIHRAQLTDGLSVMSREMILAPDQKHGCLFPERIDGQLIMATRPLVRTYVSAAGIWLYSSDDGARWKVLGPVVLPSTNRAWDGARVGPGAPPIKTTEGWLLFYYGVDKERSYHVGAVMLDLKTPTKMLSRTSLPIFSPEHDWELNGRRADTVFPSGAIVSEKDIVRLYYGAADTCIGVATFSLDELIGRMARVQ